MLKKPIPMVDLKSQYNIIKKDVDAAIQEVIDSSAFINGKAVKIFEQSLATYLQSKHVVACANGTDALQIALMALDLHPEDEIIVPAFTYAATAEVVALFGFKLIMVDVEKDSFNISIQALEDAITPKTKVIVPVHLFGQSANMEPIMELAVKYNLWVIEDNAQSLGSEYAFSNGKTVKTGTIGHIGCTSFFPSKNLGCFGDGGALCTNDDQLAEKLKMIANHGQKVKYHHSIIGCNSRLDTIQAAILNVKLKYFDEHLLARQKAASFYDHALQHCEFIVVPSKISNAKHTYNQYTLKVKNGRRDALQKYLLENNIPSMIYYPIPLYKQEAFKKYVTCGTEMDITEALCDSVLSIPIHTEMNEEIQTYIVQTIMNFNG
jgi:UDP-2-acetamido-2-deoxy-ribo-hexuluronate aminotransferase